MRRSAFTSDVSPRAAPPALDVRTHALFLDLDGTLAPIVERPEQVFLSDDVTALLARLVTAMDGAIALVTGRTIADADRILGGAIQYVAGVHGLETRRAAEVFRADIDHAAVAAARMEAQALLRDRAPGSRIEDKTASVAFHFRQTPASESNVRAIAQAVAAKHGLFVLEGKMVIELVAGARTKADALEAFLAEAPFAGRAPVAVGDDRTDEDAFAAANHHGGFAVLVGETRASAARYTLASPAAVAAWLEAALVTA